MKQHVRVVAFLWGLVGAAFALWGLWGLITEEHSMSVVTSWLLVLAFALLAVFAALSFGRAGVLGRVMVRLVAGLVLVYSLAWLLFGGVDDALSYLPALVCLVVLATYSFVTASREARAP